MPPSQQEPPSRQNSDMASQSRQSRISEHMARSTGVPQRLRNDESWVEISSQPSSSSLSSIGDEIVTTGLRVQPHRRRRVQGTLPTRMAHQTSTSSQEEYDESESEDDHVMTSSNEHIIPTTNLQTADYSSDEDENATALGRRTEPAFTPQPNVFSRPPSQVPNSYFPNPSSSRPNPYTSRRHHSYAAQTDHDAALRASLTTLLSIGAAVKRNTTSNTATGNEPMGLRLVPESELVNPLPRAEGRAVSPSTRARSSPSISSQDIVEKGKRKANAASEKVKRRKKVLVQDADIEGVSPTLLTWVVSAGVLVLVSVVGFGAGYVIGREVGRQEVSSFGIPDTSCGREAVRGTGSLRRFKWGIGGGGRSVVA